MTDIEIIATLATKLMGWQHIEKLEEIGEYVAGRKKGTAWFYRPEGDGIGVVGVSHIADWNPLADPAACAQVLDAIEARGWGWRWRFDEIDKIYGFDIYQPKSFVKLGYDEGNPRYRAVCLAALRALGQDG